MAFEAKERDFYAILGVRRNASEKEINKAYKKLVKKYHPDRNKERENWAKKKFIDVTDAYETLKDEKKRKLYDRGGEEAVKRGE